MPKNLDLKGPAFVGLKVRDVQASADFYEKTLGLRRDPDLTYSLWDDPGTCGYGLGQHSSSDPCAWHLVQGGEQPGDSRRLGQGRQFTFVDLDGYAITIYDWDEPADGWSQANS